MLALFSMPPHSRVLSCVPLHSVTQCTIDSFVSGSWTCGSSRVALQQAFDPLPACFAVGLLSSLASSQIPALGTTLAETPLLEVYPAKIGPRNLVFHQHFSWVSGHHLSGLSIPTWMSNALSLPSGDQGVARISSILPASHLSDSGHSPDVRRLCLDRQSLLGDTTASDDEFSMPTNTPGWNRGSHFPPLSGLAGMHRILCPNSRIGVLSLRLCSLCSGVFPSLPRSHLHQVCRKLHQHNILASGGTLAPMRCFSGAFSVLARSATSPMIPLD